MAEVAVIGVPDETWGEMVIALVVDRRRRAHRGGRHRPLPEALAGYKCPKRVEFVAELPRTATGKLQKFRLRAPYWEGRDRQVD